MSKSKFKFKPDPKGFKELTHDISKNPEDYVLDVKCPDCGQTVHMQNGVAYCTNCNRFLSAKSSEAQ